MHSSSSRRVRRYAVAILFVFTTLVSSVASAEPGETDRPTTWFTSGLHTAASADGRVGPPAGYAVSGVGKFSLKFLNIGPWWEAIPSYHFRFGRQLDLSVGVGLQQFGGTVSPRAQVGARGRAGQRIFYSATLEVDATHTALPGGVGWGGLLRAGGWFRVGDGSFEALLRYEGGGIGGGPAIAYRIPAGAVSVRTFVGSTLLTGDPTTETLADFTTAPVSGVGGMSVSF